ncbi:MAG: CHAT domain-containing protein, partial [Anaerolineae bacterium]
NIIIQAEQVLIHAAQAAQIQGRDPARMLRVLAVLAAPVHNPSAPEHPPPPLDLQQEWHELAEGIRESRAPILLARIVPPTLDALRRALSPRAEAQDIFPHVLHFSGHAWKGGLLLEDEYGRVHAATTDEILDALRGMPCPLDLVVLNGCESAAEARSAAQALVEKGLARAAVGHPRPVSDPEAVRFAARLYAELSDGFPLWDAVERARQAVTTHEVLLLGEKDLRFAPAAGGEPWIDDRRPPGNLPSRPGHFFGRGPHLVEIAGALARPPRVVLLSGPAAIGKTALALEAAHRNAHRFPGGVAFAEGPRPEAGRPATAADLLLQLAAGLGMEATPDNVAEKLAEHTRLTPTLLLLDNLEGLPSKELDRLRAFLNRLGPESAAIALARPPQEALEDLPTACPISLHEGIGPDAATRYVSRLAEEKAIGLEPGQVGEIVRATDGHPRLVELIVAQAGRRDLSVLLQEVRERRGDFVKQLEKVHDWSARLLEEKGHRRAWQALLLFPAGRAPEGPLWAAAGREGAEALREAALADFDPRLQAWRWHGSVAEYARLHWPLEEDERRARLEALLPEWIAWLEDLGPGTPETASRLEAQQDNLAALLGEADRLPGEPLRALLRALHPALPAPDQTLALRPLEERVYRTWAGLATEDAERATALGMLGYALSALGRREEALAATQEAV